MMRTCFGILICIACSLLAGVAAAADSAQSNAQIFNFEDWAGPTIKVYMLRPGHADASAPVVFVMHGVRRDGDRYFDDWKALSEKFGFVLVVPEFSNKAFPKAAAYNLGGVVGENGAITPRESWAYSSIEPIFDEVVKRLDLDAREYLLYGHSAGAQFAHRFALFGSGPRARMVISANAGWYTFPDVGEWPYGPDGLPNGVFNAARALEVSLVVLAGEADIDPDHPSLRRTKEAMSQGLTRFDRARAFYAAGQRLAEASGVTFAWSCVTAPGVDHNDAKAAPFAVTLFLESERDPGGPCRQGVAVE